MGKYSNGKIPGYGKKPKWLKDAIIYEGSSPIELQAGECSYNHLYEKWHINGENVILEFTPSNERVDVKVYTELPKEVFLKSMYDEKLE